MHQISYLMGCIEKEIQSRTPVKIDYVQQVMVRMSFSIFQHKKSGISILMDEANQLKSNYLQALKKILWGMKNLMKDSKNEGKLRFYQDILETVYTHLELTKENARIIADLAKKYPEFRCREGISDFFYSIRQSPVTELNKLSNIMLEWTKLHDKHNPLKQTIAPEC